VGAQLRASFQRRVKTAREVRGVESQNFRFGVITFRSGEARLGFVESAGMATSGISEKTAEVLEARGWKDNRTYALDKRDAGNILGPMEFWPHFADYLAQHRSIRRALRAYLADHGEPE
jgi:hypothetical protein